MQSTMQFTGMTLIRLQVPTTSLTATVRQQQATMQAVSWHESQNRLKVKPFNGLHLSNELKSRALDACSARHAPKIAYKPDSIAKLQSPSAPDLAPAQAQQVVVAAPEIPPQPKVTPRRGTVALRQALAQLGVPVTRIAELTHTDRRSAHKHVHATPSSKVKPWAARSQAEQTQALELARKLLN